MRISFYSLPHVMIIDSSSWRFISIKFLTSHIPVEFLPFQRIFMVEELANSLFIDCLSLTGHRSRIEKLNWFLRWCSSIRRIVWIFSQTVWYKPKQPIWLKNHQNGPKWPEQFRMDRQINRYETLTSKYRFCARMVCIGRYGPVQNGINNYASSINYSHPINRLSIWQRS